MLRGGHFRSLALNHERLTIMRWLGSRFTTRLPLGHDGLGNGTWNGNSAGWHSIKRHHCKTIGGVHPGCKYVRVSRALMQGEPNVCGEIRDQEPPAGISEEHRLRS